MTIFNILLMVFQQFSVIFYSLMRDSFKLSSYRIMNSIIAFKEVIEHNEETEDQDKYNRKDIGKCLFVLIIIIKFLLQFLTIIISVLENILMFLLLIAPCYSFQYGMNNLVVSPKVDLTFNLPFDFR